MAITPNCVTAWAEGVRYKIDKDFSLSMIFIREIMGVPCRGGAPVANICLQWLDWTPFIEGGETYFPPILLPGEAPCPPPPGGFPAPLPHSASLPICGGDPAAAGIDGHANALGPLDARHDHDRSADGTGHAH